MAIGLNARLGETRVPVSVAYWIARAEAVQTAICLTEQTGAPVAWYNMAIWAGLTALGLLSHLLSKRDQSVCMFGDCSAAGRSKSRVSGFSLVPPDYFLGTCRSG